MSSSQANAKMRKFPILRGVLDGLRSSVSAPTKSDTEIEETLRSEHFHTCKTVRHGFPFQPTAVAFDPVQHILAIGNKTGSLRIIGRPGVDIHSTHDGEVGILQILFLINEGALVTVCTDDTLHLWNYRQKKPDIVHSLKFQRERITYCHLPFQSKWLYIGTERGNVHIVNIESFVLSGYVINWNKAIELCRKTHPGPVVHLSDNPVDTNKLLIGFESGAIVMWDLRNKFAEYRYNSPEALRAISWHQEGKQFMCCHSDGSLTTWNVKAPHKSANVLLPHARLNAEGKPDPCKPITKVAWKTVRNGEDMVIFSGGMSYERAGRTPSITVMTGKSTTVLEMEHNVIDFVVLCETPWSHDLQDPYAIVVLLQNDLVVVDLTSPGYPCFENPYPMDLHESPVTACQYYANCPVDLIPAFYSVGSRQKKTGFSEKVWPVKGGQWGTTTVSYPEIMITGHADGSLKVWDASSVSLQILYKLKTAKIFDKPKRPTEVQDDDPFAIQIIFLCPESRMLCVAGASHVMLFRFCKQEVTLEVSSLEFSIVYEIFDEMESPDFEYPTTLPRPSLAVTNEYNSSMGSYSSSTSDNAKTEQMTAVKVRPGARKWAAGYQPDLVCILCYVEGEPPGNITVMSLNSSYGLLAFGNESGLAIVDFVQKTCLLNLGTPDLYGSMDPYQRAPRSPRSKKSQSEGVKQSEEGKSPTTDLLPPVQSAMTKTPPPIPPPRSKHKRIQPLTSIEESKVTLRRDDQDSTASALDPTSPAADRRMPDVPLSEDVDRHSAPVTQEGEGACSRTLNITPSQENSGDACAETQEGDLEVKTSLCKALSDQGSVAKAEQEAEHLDLRPSLSDSNKDIKDPEQPVKSASVVSRFRMKSRKLIRQVNSGMKTEDNGHLKTEEGDKTEEPSVQSKEEAESPSAVDDGSPQSPVQPVTEDSASADNKSPDPSQPQHSKSFFRKVSVKLKSSFAPKSRTDSEAETEKRPSSERTKSPLEKKVEVIDLTEDSDRKPSVRKVCVVDMCSARGDRNDGSSFSRSRSSSISSLDNVTKEAIQCLVFADSYTRKTDNFTCPCLWVGTSLGSVIVINLNLPGLNGDQRAMQPVIVSPSGTIFRLKGAIVGMSFLDCNGILIQSVYDQWKDGSVGGGSSSTSLVSYGREREKDNRDVREEKAQKASRQMSVSTKPKISPTSSQELTDRQFVIICSEKQARVMSLPSQTCAYKVKITETSFVVRAEIVSLRDSVCMMCYVANGHIMAFSLPSLKPLYDDDFLPLTDYRLARTFCFSNNGHALFLCSPTEVQKITYSAEIAENLSEMLGDLFLPCDTPEAPKQGFFKNLFGGGTSNLDREELFGEASGKASKGLAKHIPGAGGIQHLQQQTGAVGGEFARTRLLVDQRGERLGELDDSSARMLSQAENFAQAAHHIMLKYKDKKWYQF
ncbi:syntaxin-binding protein 5-like [Babylonia areolata]|uniref:syntaxin-binding protein 5-like n=1 Tax=Babylonia areolata TaxID=304850 RepID=UPI003FD42943